MDVRVHDPRHEDRVAAVDCRHSGWGIIHGADALDLPAQDVHRGRPHAFRRYDPPAGEEEIGEHRSEEGKLFPLPVVNCRLVLQRGSVHFFSLMESLEACWRFQQELS